MPRLFDGQKVLIASHNSGKVREIGALLAPFGVEVTSASALGLPVPEETEDSFAGNARLKGHAAARASGLVSLADDSGLCVDALNGAPGIHTADWAETENGRDFGMAMEKTWSMIEAQGLSPPIHATFHCTLCLAWPDGHDEIFEGNAQGHLVWPPRGTLGFGYDPMFVPNGDTQTFGEMDPDRKTPLTHRAHAFALLVKGSFAGR